MALQQTQQARVHPKLSVVHAHDFTSSLISFLISVNLFSDSVNQLTRRLRAH